MVLLLDTFTSSGYIYTLLTVQPSFLGVQFHLSTPQRDSVVSSGYSPKLKFDHLLDISYYLVHISVTRGRRSMQPKRYTIAER